MIRKAQSKPFTEMTTKELAEATAEFNESMVIDRSRPLTKQERIEWEQWQKQLCAPRTKKSAESIVVCLDRKLLKNTDSLAKKRGISRDALIARGLKALLAAEED